MIVNKHKTSDGRLILTICDDELIGKKFEEGKLQLDLDSKFYRGEKADKSKIEESLKKAYIVNIVGKESIEFCIEKGIADKTRIINIKGIPHTQVLFL